MIFVFVSERSYLNKQTVMRAMDYAHRMRGGVSLIPIFDTNLETCNSMNLDCFFKHAHTGQLKAHVIIVLTGISRDFPVDYGAIIYYIHIQ